MERKRIYTKTGWYYILWLGDNESENYVGIAEKVENNIIYTIEGN